MNDDQWEEIHAHINNTEKNSQGKNREIIYLIISKAWDEQVTSVECTLPSPYDSFGNEWMGDL